MKAKFVEEKIMRCLMVLSITVLLFFVASVLWSIFHRGCPVLT